MDGKRRDETFRMNSTFMESDRIGKLLVEIKEKVCKRGFTPEIRNEEKKLVAVVKEVVEK